MGCRTCNKEFALGGAHGPIHLLVKGRQQGQICIVQGKFQPYLLIVIQGSGVIHLKGPGGHNAPGTGLICSLPHGLLHLHALYVAKSIAHLQHCLQRIKGRACHTAVASLDFCIKGRIMQIAAKSRCNISPACNISLDPPQLGKHSQGKILGRKIGSYLTVMIEINRSLGRERALPL